MAKTVRIKLREVLEQRNMTQKELAELIGVREATVSTIARNHTLKVNYDILAKIMDKLELESFDDVLELVDE